MIPNSLQNLAKNGIESFTYAYPNNTQKGQPNKQT